MASKCPRLGVIWRREFWLVSILKCLNRRGHEGAQMSYRFFASSWRQRAQSSRHRL
jgi:hypothetical protein